MNSILFVDDESKILDGIRRMLHADRNRWDMHFAIGAEAALQACEEHSFDVVISDMRMPGMDGITLLGQIQERFPRSVRIILSGYSEAGLTTRAVPVAHRYLSKPCEASELRSTIERVCTLQDTLHTHEMQQILGKIGDLPSLSSSYAALAKAVQNPDVSVDQVAKIIEGDVAMSVKILQLVNSAFFGLARAVTSAKNAVGYLGIQTIKNLALTSEAFRILVPDRRIPEEVCLSIQMHARRTAEIATVLPINAKVREVTILAALLHDVGRLVLATKMPDKFCQVLAWCGEHKCEPYEAEEELMGTSHAEIGAYLLGLWGLPDLAIEAIAFHHRPTRIPHSGFDSPLAVYVADLLAHEKLRGKELRNPDQLCLEELGVLHLIPELRERVAQLGI